MSFMHVSNVGFGSPSICSVIDKKKKKKREEHEVRVKVSVREFAMEAPRISSHSNIRDQGNRVPAVRHSNKTKQHPNNKNSHNKCKFISAIPKSANSKRKKMDREICLVAGQVKKIESELIDIWVFSCSLLNPPFRIVCSLNLIFIEQNVCLVCDISFH